MNFPTRSTSVTRQFLIFGCVGTAGFLVDSAVLLALMHYADAGPYSARLVSFLCAASFTWIANRTFTFSASAQTPWSQWLRFVLVSAGGGLINYGVFALLIARVSTVAEYPVLGVAAGSLAGLLVNFTLSRTLVFKNPSGSMPATRANGGD